MSGAEMLALEMSDRVEAIRQERDAAVARAEKAEARAIDNHNSANFYREDSNQWMTPASEITSGVARVVASCTPARVFALLSRTSRQPCASQ